MKHLLWIGVLGFIGCNQFAEPETYLIPREYKGEVWIIFNQKSGQEIEYEGDRRLYRIPENGILFTQFQDEYGHINKEYYYEEEGGKRTRLDELEVSSFNEEYTTDRNENEPSREKIGVFFSGRVGVSGVNTQFHYQEFFVCPYNELDSFYTNPYQDQFHELVDNIRKGE